MQRLIEIVEKIKEKGWDYYMSEDKKYVMSSNAPAVPVEPGEIRVFTGVPFSVKISEYKSCCSGNDELEVRLGGPGQFSTITHVDTAEQAMYWLEMFIPVIEKSRERGSKT